MGPPPSQSSVRRQSPTIRPNKVHMALTMLDRRAGFPTWVKNIAYMMQLAPVVKHFMEPARAATPTPWTVHAALRSPSAAYAKYPAAQPLD